MTNFHATERCPCGATITIEAYTERRLADLLTEWRLAHRHTIAMFSRDAPFDLTPEPEVTEPTKPAERVNVVIDNEFDVSLLNAADRIELLDDLLDNLEPAYETILESHGWRRET